MTMPEQAAPHVLLGVTGCVAAYKAAEVLRGLQKAGCEVRVVMTADASRFVGPDTFRALTEHEVLQDVFAYGEDPIPHIRLTSWADLVLVAPATANVLAKAAHGIADDALTSCLLAADSPVLFAPAMNLRMWGHPATRRNVTQLKSDGARVVAPASGRLACGDDGEGKLASVDDIVSSALCVLRWPTEGPLAGKRVVVTAGPTHEAIDPVRYIANASSGKMGYAVAEAARDAGAEVTLVSGPVALPAPGGVTVVPVTSAAQMHDATLAAFEGADIAVCAAAVADYTPATVAERKLRKGTDDIRGIDLKLTPDILAELCAAKGDRVVVGFAAETNDLIVHATEKLTRKGCDLIVANDVSRPESTFGSDTNVVTLVTATGARPLPALPKREVAERIIVEVERLLPE